jgi:hypothetical protein
MSNLTEEKREQLLAEWGNQKLSAEKLRVNQPSTKSSKILSNYNTYCFQDLKNIFDYFVVRAKKSFFLS